ncbi:MAG: Nif3-like dinuclear metal center hexameric protein [Deltaproteobacteria bacterium]|nr:Nif3-like dinuclear metal center hexameric protein [Deltaproteobacteria bacterium]
MPRIADCLSLLDELFPPRLAEEKDPIGIQLGDPSEELRGVATALEATLETVQAAADAGANLLVTHHPLLFRPMARIVAGDPNGDIVRLAIARGVTVFACHTNADWVDGGLNDRLAQTLGLRDVRPVTSRAAGDFFKVAVFTPEEALFNVAEAMFAAGGGVIGEYTKCSFRTPGTGTFLPSENADPYSGKIGELANEAEFRLEVLVPGASRDAVVAAMISAHPYEEPAYDVYPLAAARSKHGVARVGELEAPETPRSIAARLKKSLRLDQVRAAGPIDATVRRVALCTGGGAFLFDSMTKIEGGVYVTGDVRYHDARFAEQINYPLLEIGHFEAEISFAELVAEKLSAVFAAEKIGVPVRALRIEKNPFVLL